MSLEPSGGGRHSCDFYGVISTANLLAAWKEFSKGKRSKDDVVQFALNLEDNIFYLHDRLLSGTWESNPYVSFFVHDPKLRKIHKASVRDRVLYQAVYRKLYQIFDPSFIFHSYSSRESKGTHAGTLSFEKFIRSVTGNHTKSAWILKCDIRKFFDSIDHSILLKLIEQKVHDQKLLSLVRKIVDSFAVTPGKGLPLGNVTSQLFANIYLNELDQFVKRELKAKYYARYCDDFGIIAHSRERLDCHLNKMKHFCEVKLLLNIHPNKIIFRKSNQGVDFLGYILLPHYRVLRTKTKNRLLKKLTSKNLQSYLGVLSHCKGRKIEEQIKKKFPD